MSESLQQESLGLVKHFTGIDCTWEQLEILLKKHLLYLLEKDLPALYHMLYRIDVSEARVRAIFGGETDDIAADLARLIIERIQQKAEMRLRYKIP